MKRRERTSDHRKAIPTKIKVQVLINQARCAACGEHLGTLANTEFDHRPALVLREWDEKAGDYVPPQLDPNYIEVIHVDCHQFRTTGKRGEKTVTTRGSDVGEAARIDSISAKQAEFRRRILRKRPGQAAKKSKSRWPKRKFGSAR